MLSSARCRGTEAEDIRQEIRLALWEIRDLPMTRDEARATFLRLASRFECRSRRAVYRQGALVDQPEELAAEIERDATRSLALFNALEKLSDHERWLVKECKIEERSHAEVARQLGVSDHTVGNRLWRAMTKLIAMLKDEEKKLEKDQKARGVIAPLAFEFTDTQRAAFKAIWSAEGRIPTFGGGPPDPPAPPRTLPMAPSTAPAAMTPLLSANLGGIVSAIAAAIVLVLLLVPAGVAATCYFANPPLSQTAKKGLLLPDSHAIDDVDPVVPIYEDPAAQAPPARTLDDNSSPTSSGAQVPVRASKTTNSSPSIDPEELERAHRRSPPRFLPSR